MSKRSSVPHQDGYGEPIEPGDVTIDDAVPAGTVGVEVQPTFPTGDIPAKRDFS